MIELGDGARFGQIRFGFFRTGDETAMGDLDRDGPLQLVVVGQVNQTKTALAQDSFHPVAADVLGRGLSRDGRDWFPFWLINGPQRIVHTNLLSLAVAMKYSPFKE